MIENRGTFLVRQRPEGVVNAHLWEFPNIELNGSPLNASAAAKELYASKARDMLGWKPKRTFTELVAEMMASDLAEAKRDAGSAKRTV